MRGTRRIALVIAPIGLGAATVALAAINLNSSKSNVYRVGGAVIVSGTATMSGPRETQTAIEVPAAGDFVLTQACAGAANGGIRVEVKGPGGGPLVELGAVPCIALQPGISVKAGTSLVCSTSAAAAAGGDYFCTLSGLWTR